MVNINRIFPVLAALLFTAFLLSCTSGMRRVPPPGVTEESASGFVNPAIGGLMNSVAPVFYALTIERAIFTGTTGFPRSMPGYESLDTLFDLRALSARRTGYDYIASTIDSIDIDIRQGDRPAGNIKIREFMSAFVISSQGGEGDPLGVNGKIVILEGEYEMFGRRFRPKPGTMTFSTELCNSGEKPVKILNESYSISGHDGRKGTYGGERARVDAADMGIGQYAYMTAEMSLDYCDSRFSSGFLAYGVFDQAADADSASCVAIVYLTIELQGKGPDLAYQETIRLQFDDQTNLTSINKNLADIFPE